MLRYRLRYYDYLLRQRLGGRYVFIHINKCGGTSVEAALGIPVKIHDSARVRRQKLGASRWDDAFTFAVVRHPYSRLISLYKYRILTNQTALGQRPIGINDWLREIYERRNPAYHDKPLMFAPCFDWVSDAGGRIIVDYLGRLETIGEDWPLIQARTGSTAVLPVRNASGAGPGWDVLEPATRSLIQQHFAKDFEVFGYEP